MALWFWLKLKNVFTFTATEKKKATVKLGLTAKGQLQ
jgi:hypothetical protein